MVNHAKAAEAVRAEDLGKYPNEVMLKKFKLIKVRSIRKTTPATKNLWGVLNH